MRALIHLPTLKSHEAERRESASQARAIRITSSVCRPVPDCAVVWRGLACDTVRLKGDQRPWGAGWVTSDCRETFMAGDASFNITSKIFIVCFNSWIFIASFNITSKIAVAEEARENQPLRAVTGLDVPNSGAAPPIEIVSTSQIQAMEF